MNTPWWTPRADIQMFSRDIISYTDGVSIITPTARIISDDGETLQIQTTFAGTRKEGRSVKLVDNSIEISIN